MIKRLIKRLKNKIILILLIVLIASCMEKKYKSESSLIKKIGYNLKAKEDTTLIMLYKNELNNEIYKQKRDSLIKIIKTELNKSNDTIWTYPILNQLKEINKQSELEIKMYRKLYKNSFGSQYRELRSNNKKYEILNNQIYKNQYLVLLSINYNIRKNISKIVEYN